MEKRKRAHLEVENGSTDSRKQVKPAHGTIISQSKTVQNNYDGQGQAMVGADMPVGSSVQRDAKEWLMSALTHLRALEERPDLATACMALLGKDISGTARELRETISSKRAAIKAVDSGKQYSRQPWNSRKSDIDKRVLPPLPEIRDEELARRAFRHKSTLSNADVMSGDMHLDYEQLEFEGDSYLHIISTRFLCDRFPHYDEGKLTRLREILVCNETLAQFSLQYGFDDRLQIVRKIEQATSKTVEGRNTWTKILGDIFEAFVAAVIQSRPDDGFTVVEDWLHVLFSHRLPGAEPLEVRKDAKEALARKLISKGIKITYEPIKPPFSVGHGRQLFTMGVYLTGWGLNKALLAQGTGTSKTEAGNRAADTALLSPITTEASFIKRKFDALWKEEQEREDGPRQEVLDQLDADWK